MFGVEALGAFEADLPDLVGWFDVGEAEDGDDLVGAFGARRRVRVGGRLASCQQVFDAVEDVLVVDAECDQDLVEQVERVSPGAFADVLARSDVDGDDDGGDLAVAGCLAQGAADGLDDVDGARLGVGEQDGVDGGDVDAFGAAAAVGQDGPARRLRPRGACRGGWRRRRRSCLVAFERTLAGVDCADLEVGWR